MAINKAKEDGNTAFRKQQYAEAVRLFTLAIDVAASRPLWENNQMARDELALCLANRSAALAAVQEWVGALCDAEACVKLKRPWPKAHYRKGKALEGLGRHSEAREAYELGLQFDPRSVVS
jgi:translocation protein SEC72